MAAQKPSRKVDPMAIIMAANLHGKPCVLCQLSAQHKWVRDDLAILRQHHAGAATLRTWMAGNDLQGWTRSMADHHMRNHMKS